MLVDVMVNRIVSLTGNSLLVIIFEQWFPMFSLYSGLNTLVAGAGSHPY